MWHQSWKTPTKQTERTEVSKSGNVSSYLSYSPSLEWAWHSPMQNLLSYLVSWPAPSDRTRSALNSVLYLTGFFATDRRITPIIFKIFPIGSFFAGYLVKTQPFVPFPCDAILLFFFFLTVENFLLLFVLISTLFGKTLLELAAFIITLLLSSSTAPDGNARTQNSNIYFFPSLFLWGQNQYA